MDFALDEDQLELKQRRVRGSPTASRSTATGSTRTTAGASSRSSAGSTSRRPGSASSRRRCCSRRSATCCYPGPYLGHVAGLPGDGDVDDRRSRRVRSQRRRGDAAASAPATAAEALGVAQRALDLGVEHAKTRVQFGKPIGTYQAVSHPLAQTYTDVELARSLVYWAAWCVAEDDERAPLAAAAAKAFATEAAVAACERSIQVHGGIGFTWEHPLHRFYKRAHLARGLRQPSRRAAARSRRTPSSRRRMSRMDGLMMDFPLTLTHLLRRAETFFGDGEIVTRLPDKSFHRTNHRDTLRRARQLAVALQKAGLERGDRVATLCWNHHQHHEAYFGVPCGGFVLHTLNLRLHPNDLELHREPRRRPRRDRRPRAPAAARAVPGGDADRARLRRRGLVRGAARDRRSRRVGGPGARRERGGGDVLHERHDRPAARRRLLAPLVRPARARRRREQPARAGLRHRRRRDAGRADVPRERLGLPVPRHDAGREARLPRPASRPRQPAREHGARAGLVGRGRADHLDGDPRAARRRARPLGPLRDEGDARRRLRGAARDDRGLRGAARHPHLPGLGHDRDVAGRLHRRAARTTSPRRTTRRAGTSRRWSASRFRSSRSASGAGDEERAVGRRGDGRARGARPVGRRVRTTTRPRAPTAGRTTAGSAPATSSRSIRAASSRSRTARRT